MTRSGRPLIVHDGPRLALVTWATAIVVSLLARTMLVTIGAEAVGIELFDALRG